MVLPSGISSSSRTPSPGQRAAAGLQAQDGPVPSHVRDLRSYCHSRQWQHTWLRSWLRHRRELVAARASFAFSSEAVLQPLYRLVETLRSPA